MTLLEYKLTSNGIPSRKLKLNGSSTYLQATWISKRMIAISTNTTSIQVIDIEKNENYILMLPKEVFGEILSVSKLSAIGYNKRKKVLACGTDSGHIVLWNSTPGLLPTQWKAKKPIITELPNIKRLAWENTYGLLYAVVPDGLTILIENRFCKKMNSSLQLVQVTQKHIEVRMLKSNTSVLIEVNFRIRGIDCTENHVLVWSGKQANIYEMISTGNILKASFMCKSISLALFKDLIIACREKEIELYGYDGILKQSINTLNEENENALLEIGNEKLIVTTKTSQLKIWNTNKWKRIIFSRELNIGNIKQILLNCDGSKLCMVCNMYTRKFYVYDIVLDNIQEYEVRKGGVVVCCLWDLYDKRFLGVEVEWIKANEIKKELITFFVTSDSGIREHTRIECKTHQSALLGISIPFYYIIDYNTNSNTNDSQIIVSIKEKCFAEYEDIKEDLDEELKSAISNFTASLANNDIDKAYTSIRRMNNPQLWKQLGNFCIRNKRPELAEVCLTNLNNPIGTNIIKHTKDIDEQLAIVAIYLNKLELAKGLYRQCTNKSLLVKFLEICGEWEEAIEVAKKYDKIRLSSLYYKIGQYYECSGNISLAVKYYELSGNEEREVPRILQDNGMARQLLKYIETSKNPKLCKWYGRFMESKGDMKTANKFYRLGNDYAALTRIACESGDIETAERIATNSKDLCAAYYLARKYEYEGEIHYAIEWYTKAHRLLHAIKLAKERQMDTELFNLVLMSAKVIKLQYAEYFENKQMFKEAAILYGKGGNEKMAEKLSKEHNLTEQLTALTKNAIQDKSLPQSRSSELTNAQTSINFLLQEKRYKEVLDLCERNKVKMTKDLADKILYGDNSKKSENLVMQVAKLCKRQELFDIAFQLYTQLNKKEKAMKCLVKQGNIGLIISYATSVKDPRVYILAADYLNTNANSKTDITVLSTIVDFYKQAKDYEGLARFYESQAQNEVNEYRDYEKASAAMTEALRAIRKVPTSYLHKQLEYKAKLISDFVKAQHMGMNGERAKEMLSIYDSIIESPDAESAVRVGDVIAQVIEYYCNIKNYKKAYKYLQKIIAKGINISPYLDQSVIDGLYNVLGLHNDNNGKVAEESDYNIYM